MSSFEIEVCILLSMCIFTCYHIDITMSTYLLLMYTCTFSIDMCILEKTCVHLPWGHRQQRVNTHSTQSSAQRVRFSILFRNSLIRTIRSMRLWLVTPDALTSTISEDVLTKRQNSSYSTFKTFFQRQI